MPSSTLRLKRPNTSCPLQFWERLLLLVTDPKRRPGLLESEHATYLQTVPFKIVAAFTLLQLAYLLGVWALTTFAGVRAQGG